MTYSIYSTNLCEPDDFDDEDDEMSASSEASVDNFETLHEIFSDEIEKSPELFEFFNQVLTARRDEIDELTREKERQGRDISSIADARERSDESLDDARRRIKELERDLRLASADDDRFGKFVWWCFGLLIQSVMVGIIVRLILFSRNS